ncbi:MAG: type II toxin-antitoxin system death-on-curing family toxin [Candidatus Binatus sp.]|uniref:type II toxin-antitoxin system death-on-curing family toxin n=1 Tax=Candidatus Binatus sp. TaxID=2811406 RepID=UPI0027241843|nr:type II toxin-antitoxin system death-on-curing family toxin [Candidatus Binatus sp.]MDO8430789.1 type II toxin-antitoxin system death-on-curing family toxin [Candidatus Binatus sp.]
MNADPWAHLISLQTIRQIHSDCIARFGGDATKATKEGCVERSLGAAWSAELYSENMDAVQGLCFAGCLLYYLIKNHCFVDGNKRVGWAAGMEVLRALELGVRATDDEVEEFCLAVVENDSSLVKNAVDVAVWLAPRLTALQISN